MRKLRWMEWITCLLAGMALGALLATLDGRGQWWHGWLAFSLLSTLACVALLATWRWMGSNRVLGLILILVFATRLGLGVGLSFALPVSGYDTPVQKAGYNSVDAYDRDMQSWELATSGRSLGAAFDKSYAVDQYGGLEALSALVYRGLSSDTHRPWLIILLAALSSALGVAFFWQATRSAWGEKISALAAWGMAFYPESIWLGASQMREPFLLFFIALVFFGVVHWQVEQEQKGWLSIAFGLAGMLFFSPGIAIYSILLLAGWVVLRRKHMRLPWKGIGWTVGVLIVALILFWVALRRGTFAGAPFFETLTGWFKYSMAWDIYQLERDSGMIQHLFRNVLSPQLKLPFIFIYGLLQPVLPAALFDPSTWLWQTVGILRSLGWYLILPLLVFALIAILRSETGVGRAAWLWLFAMNGLWIAISVLRAGGDQWDNPRYRLIFLGFQAVLAAKAWLYYQDSHNEWFRRILMIELVFTLLFVDWYASRAFPGFPALSFMPTMLAIVSISVIIIAVGLWLDRRKYKTQARNE